ncbi:hypothetical protein MTR_2g097615 [Medicago truncatula]|uniref:Uncharacterized protein n=1 Tax=Medicago truncatula TaxID=3880 RepID=A0A072VBR7_MEDTR|nr:hypothetical protein MTR_2g097615 [Medicago truncatula]
MSTTVYAVTTTDEKSERPPFVERLMPTSQVVKERMDKIMKRMVYGVSMCHHALATNPTTFPTSTI